MPLDRDQMRLLNLVYGYVGSHLMATACKLGIVDAIGDDTMTSTALAEHMGTHEQSLRRVLRALTTYGVLEAAPGDGFRVTSMGRMLKKDAPGSFFGAVETGFDGLTRDRAWHALPQAVKTGHVAFEIATGGGFFAYLDEHPSYLETFFGAMDASIAKVFDVLSGVDFGRYRSLLDVGGADGTLAAHLKSMHPHLECTVYDTPAVLERAAAAGKASRQLRYVPGDFFEAVPHGADCYMLSRIIDDWPDEKAQTLLVNIRNAMNPHAVLIIVGPVKDPDDYSFDATLSDLSMLVYMGGAKRTADELGRLLRAVGLAVLKEHGVGRRHRALECVVAS